MIKPTDYQTTIEDYVRWQNETVRCFQEQYRIKERCNRLTEIERLWNWNLRENEGLYFAGAARPFHLKKVTDFAAMMSIFYDRLWPIFKTNRDTLARVLDALLRKESSIRWPNYDIFPCISSITIIDKCLQYFYFKNRDNTWFINSSLSDYIPYVNSAREIFANKFIGSDMQHPSEHNTEWIYRNLRKHCSRICREENNDKCPIIIILLTSKTRLGQRIDVDYIHCQITREFSTVITIVDGCQDGQTFTDVDIIIYSKRFSTTGAIALINKIFLSKHLLLSRKLTVGVSFPVNILAQIYISLNMLNVQLNHGVEDLVNSCRWNYLGCPVQDELYTAFGHLNANLITAEYIRGPIRYSFTEDHLGTIIILRSNDNESISLSKLWALLRKKGHALDCFVMNNSFLQANKGINYSYICELIEQKSIEELRQIEVLSSDYLVWPLVPYWISSSEDISDDALKRHLQICYDHHCCLRISIGRSGYVGRLKRFVELIESIVTNNELNVSDNSLGRHASQWTS